MKNVRRWVLTDVENDVYVERWGVTSVELGIPADRPWSIQKRRLYGGLRDGVDIVEVDNGRLKYTIVPTRGMGIWRGWIDDVVLGWNAPVKGPVNPAYVNELAFGGIGWLAGFDEWIVRCGLSSNGAPGNDIYTDNQGVQREAQLPLHGRIANLPAHFVEVRVNLDPPHEIEVVGLVDESMLFGQQLRLEAVARTTPGSNAFTIKDTVTNFRSQPAELELLYHCNFGPPLLGKGSRLSGPIRRVAPRDAAAAKDVPQFANMSEPMPGVGESVYFMELLDEHLTGKTLFMLQNRTGDRGCVLRFSRNQLPCFTVWKNPAAESDGYVVGLEPGTNFPNLRSFERQKGRVISLGAGESHEVSMTVETLTSGPEVLGVSAEIDAMQQRATTTFHTLPYSKFSAVSWSGKPVEDPTG